MSLDPLHTVLHVRRCLTLQNLGRYAEAERACDRAIELQPEIPNALWARGLSAFAQGDLPAAIRSHEQALARAPHRADIRSELVLLLLDVGLGERARQELEVARRQAGGRGAEVALTGARLDLATGAVQRISPELAALDHGHPDRRMRLDAAHLAFAAGDRELAARLRDAALAGTFNESDVYPDVYAVRWGMCGICALGLFERSRGDATGTERYLNQVASLFDELERNGIDGTASSTCAPLCMPSAVTRPLHSPRSSAPIAWDGGVRGSCVRSLRSRPCGTTGASRPCWRASTPQMLRRGESCRRRRPPDRSPRSAR
jgi:tetratricopeptide (TPR) repeat protein